MSKKVEYVNLEKTVYVCDCCGSKTDIWFSNWVKISDNHFCNECLENLGFKDDEEITFSREAFENDIEPILNSLSELKDFEDNIKEKKIKELKKQITKLKEDGIKIPKWFLSKISIINKSSKIKVEHQLYPLG